jgi:hypothetical protein
MGGTDPGVPRLDPTATVWRLRQDLVVRRGSDPSRVVLQSADDAVELHEAELSVARMLDGRRHVSEVLESAARLGIPVDVPGLARLIALLEKHGCIARGEALEDGEGARTTWPPRLAWSDSIRALFQNAVRLMRLGALADARAQLEAILELDPNLEEAKDLLALVGQGRGLEAPPVGYARGEPRRGMLAGLAVAGVLALALSGAALWLVIEHLEQPLPMHPLITPGPVVLTDAGHGASGPAAASPGDSGAAKGAPSAPIERRWRPVLAELRAPRAGRLEWERETSATVARGERLGSVGDAGSETPGLLAARARVGELTRLAATDAVYTEFLERERAEVARQEAASRHVVVAAAAGTLVLRAGPGPVRADELLAEIHETGAWSVAATLEQAAAAGAPCEVVGAAPAERAPCRVTGAAARHGRWLVQALVLEPAPWLGGEGEAALELRRGER